MFSSDCTRRFSASFLLSKITLACEAMDDMHSFTSSLTLHTIKGLRSVLHWSESNPIRILHPSFQDFLSDPVRRGSGRWFVDLDGHNDNIAICCITLLEGKLKKNICNLCGS